MADAIAFNFEAYLFVALGIVVSVIIPILRQSLPQPKGGTASVGGFLQRLWSKAKPYIILGLFSLVTGIVIVAMAGATLNDWRTGLLAGYAWDSTIQKVKG